MDLEQYAQSVLNQQTGQDRRWWLAEEPHGTIYQTVKELMTPRETAQSTN